VALSGFHPGEGPHRGLRGHDVAGVVLVYRFTDQFIFSGLTPYGPSYHSVAIHSRLISPNNHYDQIDN